MEAKQERSPAGQPVTGVVLAQGDPLEVSVSCFDNHREGTNDHSHDYSFVMAVENRDGSVYPVPMSAPQWTPLCPGVQVRGERPRGGRGTIVFRIEPEALPLFLHEVNGSEYYAYDASFGDGINRNRRNEYAVRVEMSQTTRQSDKSEDV